MGVSLCEEEMRTETKKMVNTAMNKKKNKTRKGHSD